jgi:hypothetical protein
MLMEQRNKGTGKRQKTLPAARPSAAEPVESRARPFMVMVAYVIIGLSVAGGFAMSLWPRAFGLQGSNPAIGFGLAALAAFRLYALRREVRHQAVEDAAAPPVPAQPKPYPQAPSGRARERGQFS